MQHRPVSRGHGEEGCGQGLPLGLLRVLAVPEGTADRRAALPCTGVRMGRCP